MYVETPLVCSAFFPHETYLKLENTQPAGSFKSRGMSRLIEENVKKFPDCHVYSSSGGNAGLAAAEAARSVGRPCTVVVPTVTKPRMAERIRKYGAEVVVHGSMWSEADAHLQELMREAEAAGTKPVYCHPFDNPLVWEGHSTMVDEIVKSGVTPSAIVLSCGGGGLYLGVMKGLERHGLVDKVTVYVVETAGADCFHQSLLAGKQVVTPSVNTIATSLGSTWVPQEAVDYALKYGSKSVIVSDDEAVAALARFSEDHCFIVEPACGATLAPLYGGLLASSAAKGPVIAIVCGGSSWRNATGN